LNRISNNCPAPTIKAKIFDRQNYFFFLIIKEKKKEEWKKTAGYFVDAGD
jgi:hypothetical protein